MSDNEINIFESDLVPKHEILTEEEKIELLKKLKIELKDLPRIKENDPAVKQIGAKKLDVIRIKRKSPVADEYYYYRVVVPVKKS